MTAEHDAATTVAGRRAETLALHGGAHRFDPATRAVAVPIYQTTSYQFQSAAQAARLFSMDEDGYTYSRVLNPTFDALEQRVAALEGGSAALYLASGAAARELSLLNLAATGDNVILSADIDDGVRFGAGLARLGIEARFADPSDPGSFGRASDDRTRAYYAATLPTGTLAPFPIRPVAAIGRQLGIPLIVDNSATPLLVRPLEQGATAVIYAADGVLGAARAEGGVLIDGGTFPWEEHADRFPLLTAPDDSSHGKTWVDLSRRYGPIAYVVRVRGRLLRDFGPAGSPFGAFRLVQALETLPIRIRRHSATAARIAATLMTHPLVRRIHYPGQDGAVAPAGLFTGGSGGLIGIDLRDGRTAKAVTDGLELIRPGNGPGDPRSLVLPATDASPDRVRLWIGLEHPDDIIADLAQALERAA